MASTYRKTVHKRIAHNVVDRTGKRFGRLTVLARHGSRGSAALWLCRCDCGREKEVVSNCLRDGYTRSCGCSRSTGPGSRPSYRCSKQPGSAARKAVLKGYRLSAKYRGLEWSLSDSEFSDLTQRECEYCGAKPSATRVVSRNGSFTYNGIDRVDNSLGYVMSNVVPCCYTCNHAKHNMTRAAFIAWIERLVSRWTNREATAAQ